MGGRAGGKTLQSTQENGSGGGWVFYFNRSVVHVLWVHEWGELKVTTSRVAASSGTRFYIRNTFHVPIHYLHVQKYFGLHSSSSKSKDAGMENKHTSSSLNYASFQAG